MLCSRDCSSVMTGCVLMVCIRFPGRNCPILTTAAVPLQKVEGRSVAMQRPDIHVFPASADPNSGSAPRQPRVHQRAEILVAPLWPAPQLVQRSKLPSWNLDRAPNPLALRPALLHLNAPHRPVFVRHHRIEEL